MPNALLIDDQPESLLQLSKAARECGFHVESSSSLESARQMLEKELPDLVILNVDIRSADGGDDACQLISRTGVGQKTEVYLVADTPDRALLTRGMQIGADDCFERPVDIQRLESKLRQLRQELEEEPADEVDSPTGGRRLLIGESPAMRRVYRLIRKVAPTEASVLLFGDSGTGKELTAQSIHERSLRASGPFIAMNCGAIAGELIESEMFGHHKGAFTGAHKRHHGFFERASGGTLLLDEITEMSVDLQVRLLRVLENGQIRPVGGEADIAVDVRIIAATNRDPAQAVEEGSLREDLYYRLAEFPLRVPPLRERGDDVILLANAFLAEQNRLNRSSHLQRSFSDEALELLRLHDWPGNIRELKNAVARASIVASHVITPDDLPENIPANGALGGNQVRFAVGLTLAEVERQMVTATLEHFDGAKPQAAKTLGISLKTLYNRLKKYQGE